MTIGIIGATGYAGAELARILLGHPEIVEGRSRLLLASSSAEGSDLAATWANFLPGSVAGGKAGRKGALTFVDPTSAVEEADVLFTSLPHGIAEGHAKRLEARGALLIDLSADFRFDEDEETFKATYGKSYNYPELHRASVYGLPELNRARIAKARIVGNPGCYPTASALGLYPGLTKGLFRTEGIVIDAASGVTGAGKELTRSTHYAECAEGMTPYKIGEHRHAPEIERTLAKMAGRSVGLVFTPHLVPMNRGILATIYAPLERPIGAAELRVAYAEAYAAEPFVRVLPEGAVATTRNVRLSNYCDVSLHIARGGKTAIVVTAIDNMVKGAAGQATQNMNIALGLAEDAGLTAVPPAF